MTLGEIEAIKNYNLRINSRTSTCQRPEEFQPPAITLKRGGVVFRCTEDRTLTFFNGTLFCTISMRTLDSGLYLHGLNQPNTRKWRTETFGL